MMELLCCRKLVGDHTVKSTLEKVQVTELQLFADDLALYATSWFPFESAHK